MYTIADISIWPWIYALYENYDNAAEVRCAKCACEQQATTDPTVATDVQTVFEGFGDLIFLKEWYQRCISRPASKKSLEVCSFVFPSY
jgi:glutathione S-transferase